MAALFSAGVPSSARGGTGDPGSGQRNLVEFRAGKMELKNRKVVADKRRGLFFIHRERESLLTHVCWKDRSTGTVEDDLIVFPDDCKWSRVSECATGRVFVLQFNSSSKKLFFWMQEPKDAKDEEYSQKINKILNEPDDLGSGADLMNNLSGSSTEQLLSHVLGDSAAGSSQEQMLQRLFQSRLGSAVGGSGSGSGGGVTGATATGGTSARNSTVRASESEEILRPVSSLAPAPMQLADFQNFMSSLSGGQSNGSTNAPTSSEVDLSSALPVDSSVLTSADVVSRLAPHVPQGPRELIPDASAEVKQSLNSPQFRQAMSLFSGAFSSGQLAPIIAQFNLGPEATTAANNSDMKAFVDALNKAAKEDTNTEGGQQDPQSLSLRGGSTGAVPTNTEGEGGKKEAQVSTSSDKKCTAADEGEPGMEDDKKDEPGMDTS